MMLLYFLKLLNIILAKFKVLCYRRMKKREQPDRLYFGIYVFARNWIFLCKNIWIIYFSISIYYLYSTLIQIIDNRTVLKKCVYTHFVTFFGT